MVPRLLLLAAVLAASPISASDDLRLWLVRHSLTEEHRHYRQYIDGVEVLGSDQVFSRRTGFPASRDQARRSDLHELYLRMDGVARRVQRRIAAERPLEPFAVYTDVETGAVLRREPLFYTAKARIFPVNPVAALNQPALQDRNDDAGAVPEAAYRLVDIVGVGAAGPLTGPHVTIVDRESPATAPVDVSQPMLFDRSQEEFEELNAYFAIDRNQRYLQSLGYTGPRQIAPYSIPVDPHAAAGADTSYYVLSSRPGEGALYFGDGGTDDAEDSDLMIHEYAHAIHDWIAPGALGGTSGTESRALAEGFGDYWTFSSTYEETVVSGRDPSCIADWDARCWEDATAENCGYRPGSDCLRRVDTTKTMADFIRAEAAGTEHRNGEIWSSALREVFLALIGRDGLAAGRRVADTLVIESLFGTPPNVTFRAMAGRILAVDQILHGGANGSIVCEAMARRDILLRSDCGVLPRGERHYFQSPDRGIAIPDASPGGITSRLTIHDTRRVERVAVHVDIDHPSRGDLQIVLVAPDGMEVVLRQPAEEQVAGLRGTYGVDIEPLQSLDALRGRVAAGEWKLRIADVFARDAGTLRSWSLVIQFSGTEALTTRPRSDDSLFIPAAGHLTGVNGAIFRTDVRIVNRAAADARLTLLFTPTGADGLTRFAAVNVVIAPQHVVTFADIVAQQFQSVGTGAIEIIGDTSHVLASSRTYSIDRSGTRGEILPAISSRAAARRGEAIFVPQLQAGADFRSNIGMAETSGATGVVSIRYIDALTGFMLGGEEVAIAPFSHLQTPVPVSGRVITAELVVRGDARIVAYGSVVDNRLGDPMHIPASTLPDEPRTVYAPVMRGAGAHGSIWTSDIVISKIVSDPTPAIAATYADSRGTVVFATLIPLGPLQALILPDAVGTVFQHGTGFGLLRLALPRGIVATSRTASGTQGQFIPFLRRDAGGADILHVENSARYRTNIGVINPDATPAETLIGIRDAAGSAVAARVIRVPPHSVVQLSLADLVREGFVDGRVSVHPTETTRALLSYASVIDNATNDPMYVPAQ